METRPRIALACRKSKLAEQESDFSYWQAQINQVRLDALEQFGFGSLGLWAADLVTMPPGVESGLCYASHVEVEIDGVTVCFIDLANLRRSKQASGRLQDLADLENLQ